MCFLFESLAGMQGFLFIFLNKICKCQLVCVHLYCLKTKQFKFLKNGIS